ncbi:hypothetical protein HZB60_04110 [candidate division KSB1 bacterium]|nr:hypothetical protein [candidate division KSB1 bacterium]
MLIPVSEKYRITTNEHQWFLQEKSGREWKNKRYYVTLDALIDWLTESGEPSENLAGARGVPPRISEFKGRVKSAFEGVELKRDAGVGDGKNRYSQRILDNHLDAAIGPAMRIQSYICTRKDNVVRDEMAFRVLFKTPGGGWEPGRFYMHPVRAFRELYEIGVRKLPDNHFLEMESEISGVEKEIFEGIEGVLAWYRRLW